MQRKKETKEKTVVMIPKSFEWVVIDMLKLNDKGFTGEVIYNFKNGGVCNKKIPRGYEIEYPPK